MTKTLRITLIVIGILFAAYTILELTNILKVYHIPTTANEPNIKLNSKIWVSNLADFKNGDFVCYNYENEMLGKHIRVHRFVGKADDILEIKDGILFINGKNFDQTIELKHFYVIEFKEFNTLLSSNKITKDDIGYRIENNMIMALSNNLAKEIGVSDKIKIEPKGKVDKLIKQLFNADWNMDNFGPITIPKEKCFVIGDNRHNSEDSRYIGFINESDVVGTVIKK